MRETESRPVCAGRFRMSTATESSPSNNVYAHTASSPTVRRQDLGCRPSRILEDHICPPRHAMMRRAGPVEAVGARRPPAPEIESWRRQWRNRHSRSRTARYAPTMATKDQQVRHVVEGAALGVLAQGVTAVTSAKMEFEFAFNHAWRQWSRAAKFPSIKGHEPGNQFWIGVGKSEGRRGARAAWQRGQWSEPYILLDGWTVEDCLGAHEDERASGSDWKELGRLFVSRFESAQLQRAAT